MRREKKERNNLIIQKINRGEYQIDIAREFNISPVMVTKIKKRYFERIEKSNPGIKKVVLSTNK